MLGKTNSAGCTLCLVCQERTLIDAFTLKISQHVQNFEVFNLPNNVMKKIWVWVSCDFNLLTLINTLVSHEPELIKLTTLCTYYWESFYQTPKSTYYTYYYVVCKCNFDLPHPRRTYAVIADESEKGAKKIRLCKYKPSIKIQV